MAAGKGTTQDLKKKKKKWIPIFAGKDFNNQQIGETYVEEAEQSIGRNVEANLMMLTRDPKKQNFNVVFRITEVRNNQAFVELEGYNMQTSQLKRITKKGRNKVDDSFVYKTKDDLKIVIKPIMLTKALTYKTTLKSIRKRSREIINEYVKNKAFQDIMNDIIDNNFQREIKNGIKIVYPVTSLIIKSAGRA